MTKSKSKSRMISIDDKTTRRGNIIADEYFNGNFSMYITNLINLDFVSKKHLFPEGIEETYVLKKRRSKKIKDKEKLLDDNNVEELTIDEEENSTEESLSNNEELLDNDEYNKLEEPSKNDEEEKYSSNEHIEVSSDKVDEEIDKDVLDCYS